MGRVTRTNFGLSKIVTLTDAQIKAWGDDSNVNIVPAITGRIIQPYLVAFILSGYVADYTNIDGGANVSFNTPTTAYAAVTLGPAAILAQGQSNVIWCDIGREFDFLPYDLNDLVSQPLNVYFDNNAAGPLTGGDAGTILRIQTFYNSIPGEGAIT